MKKYVYFSVVVAILVLVIGYQHEHIKVIQSEREVYRRDTYGLLTEVERYQTKDSLNVVSINLLELKVSELNKYRQEEMKLIASLRVDKNRLQQMMTMQTETVHELKGTFEDSVVQGNGNAEAFQGEKAAFDSAYTGGLKCIHINEQWFTMDGCIDAENRFEGMLESRDSLLYVEHIVPHRFWFIRWGVKERRQEIVSRNPHTTIAGAEFVRIRK
jgi:hypothetical protein